MKRWLAVFVCLMMLFGCAFPEESMERALTLRQRLLDAQGCSFDATVSADYGEYLHTFVLRCRADPDGILEFEVLAPDTISGITGQMDREQGKLTFDQEILAFSPLADGQIAPVTAPWILIHTLRGGYLESVADTDSGLLLSIDDSYADDALHLEILLDGGDLPARSEIFWQGRRILSLQIENFQFL